MSTAGDLEKYVTSVLIFFINDLSASGNLPLLIDCAAMEFALMGQVDSMDDLLSAC